MRFDEREAPAITVSDVLLPPRRQVQLNRDVDDYTEGLRMPFVTSFERRGMLKLIEDALLTKFGEGHAPCLRPSMIWTTRTSTRR